MKKAFTLIELLVVIVIIGIILTIAIPSVMKLMNSNSNQAYDIHMKTVESATNLYTMKNKGVLGIDTVGECYKLSYDELKKSQDIKEEEITCDGEIYIFKGSKDYNYQYNLTCVDKKGVEYSKKVENNGSCGVFDDTDNTQSEDLLLRTLKIQGVKGNNYDLSPNFNPNIFQYTVNVEEYAINILAEANNSNVKVYGTGSRGLLPGTNRYEISVKGSDGNKRVYTLTIESSSVTVPGFVRHDSYVQNSVLNATFELRTESTSVSGIKNYQYYISTSKDELVNGSWENISLDSDKRFDLTISKEGYSYVFFRAVSKIGSVSTTSSPLRLSLVIDSVAPILTYTTGYTQCTSVAGSTCLPQKYVIFTASDDSDEAFVRYRVYKDSELVKSSAAPSPFKYTFPLDGSYVIKAYAADEAGNESQEVSVSGGLATGDIEEL